MHEQQGVPMPGSVRTVQKAAPKARCCHLRWDWPELALPRGIVGRLARTPMSLAAQQRGGSRTSPSRHHATGQGLCSAALAPTASLASGVGMATFASPSNQNAVRDTHEPRPQEEGARAPFRRLRAEGTKSDGGAHHRHSGSSRRGQANKHSALVEPAPAAKQRRWQAHKRAPAFAASGPQLGLPNHEAKRRADPQGPPCLPGERRRSS